MEYKTNDWVRRKIISLVGSQELLLATIKRRKLAWLEHVTHHFLRGTLKGCDAMVGTGNAGWTSSEWTSLFMLELLTMASCVKDWKRISAKSNREGAGVLPLPLILLSPPRDSLLF